MYEHISSFEKQLQLLKSQFNETTLSHFPTLALRKAELAYFYGFKYAGKVYTLCTELTNRFDNFRKCEKDFKLFSQEFDRIRELSKEL